MGGSIMENLLNCDGKKFKAKINGELCEGVISVYCSKVYLCQDVKCGEGCPDKKGYKYSWVVGDGSGRDLSFNSVHHFELVSERPKEGDYVYVSDHDPECKEKKKRIYICESKNKIISVHGNFEKEWEKGEEYETCVWNYMQPVPKEVPILEVTCEEALQIVAKEKGINVENLRIKVKPD